jgi:hypothetical protein
MIAMFEFVIKAVFREVEELCDAVIPFCVIILSSTVVLLPLHLVGKKLDHQVVVVFE